MMTFNTFKFCFEYHKRKCMITKMRFINHWHNVNTFIIVISIILIYKLDNIKLNNYKIFKVPIVTFLIISSAFVV